MAKGKRSDGSSTVKVLWDYIKKHRLIFISAGSAVVLAAAAIIIIAAFSGNETPEEVPSPSPSPVIASPSPSPSPEPPTPSPEEPDLPANPLTGLPLENERVLENRPAAVMHNNLRAALPMFGVGQADIIYEVLAEGGITRMLAFYQDISSVPSLGAVRSTRTYFLELALAYDAFLIHAGGSPQAYQQIPSWSVSNVDGTRADGEYFWRDKERLAAGVSSEHTLFTSGENIVAALEKYSRKTVEEGYQNGLTFQKDILPAGETAAHIKVPFTKSKPTWFIYNETDGLYYVEEYNDAYVDGETGEQVAVSNVLILQTSVSVIPGDTAGRLNVDLTSGGSGYYASGGQYVPVTWSREGYNTPFAYLNEDGTPLVLSPGKIYICIIPNDMNPEFTE